MFNREEYIFAKLKEHYEDATKMGNEIFCLVLQGSQNYNLDIYGDDYKSDVDTKAIVLPSFEDFCSGKSPLSTTYVRENNEHIDFKDIRIMFETFKKQNVNFVEVLFSHYYIVPSKYLQAWKKLQALGEALTHCHPAQTLKTMAGLSFEKYKALCHPYPSIVEKINKYGYDGKQLHHIIRINVFMKNYLEGKSFAECLTARTDQQLLECIEAKLNKYSLSDAKIIAKRLDEENATLKNAFVKKYGSEIMDGRPYNELDSIKVEILRQWFKEQLQ